MRILVADDSRLARAVLRRTLAGLGYGDVAEAGDGREALAALERSSFDLVIADWEMPHVDGPGLVEEMRRGAACETPVLLASHEPRHHRIVDALQAGAQGYVRKPFDAARLRAAVHEATHSRTPGPVNAKMAALTGLLEEVGLPELIQFLTACRLDGRLTIQSGPLTGVVDFRGGEVRAASCGALFGDDAIFAISQAGSGTFRFEPAEEPVQRNVTMSVMPLLLEAMRQRDEQEATM